MEIKFSFYKDVDSKDEFFKEVSNVCFSQAPKGKVKVETKDGISSIYYVYKEKSFLPEDDGKVVMGICKCDEGVLKDLGIVTDGVIMTLDTGLNPNDKCVKEINV